MSIAFNDVTYYKGLVQLYEKRIGLSRGTISGSDDLLKEFAADVNIAFDDFLNIAIKTSGTFQFDDSNQTDAPIITTNLVSGQRNYAFTTDANGNLILDFYKIMIADSSGVFQEIQPVDQFEKNSDTSSFFDGRNNTGRPTRYDKVANIFYLDPIPNYNYSNGFKAFIDREASYFVYSDTTKKPGVPGIFHHYFYLKPALMYASRNSWVGNRIDRLTIEVDKLEREIGEYFGIRTKDEPRRLVVNYQDNK